MKSFIALFKTELKLSIRQMEGLIFGILFPAGIMAVIGYIYGDKAANPGATYNMLQLSFAGVASVGMCATGLMGIPLTLADYRHKKILKRFRVTPIRPGNMLIVQGILQFMLAVISALLVFCVAWLGFGLKMAGPLSNFLIAYFLVMLTLYSMGMLIGSLSPNMKVANIVCNILYFPMLFLSGATIPYEIMPKGFQIASNVFPLTQGIKLLKGAVTGMPLQDYTFQFVLMLGISILCLLLSIKFFKWE